VDPCSQTVAAEDAANLKVCVERLSGEVAGLRKAMRTRGVIEQAKGMLAQRLGCSPEQAFGYLSQLSQQRNVRLAELAASVVGGPGAGAPASPGAVAWRPAGDEAEGYRRLERVGRLGWAAWDLTGGAVLWSPGMYRLLRRDPARGPVAMHRMTALHRWLPPEELAALRRALREPVESGEPSGADLHLHRDGAARVLRLRTEAIRDTHGAITGLFALGQEVPLDLAGRPRPDPDHLRTERQLAAHRMRLASDRSRMERASRAAAPPEFVAALPGLRVVARHLPPGDDGPLSGDFYLAVPLPDGAVFLAVGDACGTGPETAAAMARLCAQLRGLALGGVPPARLLTLLNADLARQSAEPALASVLVARYEPAERTVTWAQAGHPAPVVVRVGGAGMPPRPPGVLLGLLPDSRYEQARLLLNEGDVLVLYTTAVVNTRRAGAGDVARQLLELTDQAAPRGLSDVVAALNPAGAKEACILAAQVVTAA
jgi:Stage II sporulation protein E (SpoIIE)/ANTAR domain